MYISHRNIDTIHDLGLVLKEACSSSGAFKYLEINLERAHDVLEDIVATIELYEQMKEIII